MIPLTRVGCPSTGKDGLHRGATDRKEGVS